MSFYENLVLQTQMNYSRYRRVYGAGKTPVKMSRRKPVSFRKYFGKFADKYGFKGAFDGMYRGFFTQEEHRGYMATF